MEKECLIQYLGDSGDLSNHNESLESLGFVLVEYLINEQIGIYRYTGEKFAHHKELAECLENILIEESHDVSSLSLIPEKY